MQHSHPLHHADLPKLGCGCTHRRCSPAPDTQGQPSLNRVLPPPLSFPSPSLKPPVSLKSPVGTHPLLRCWDCTRIVERFTPTRRRALVDSPPGACWLYLEASTFSSCLRASSTSYCPETRIMRKMGLVATVGTAMEYHCSYHPAISGNPNSPMRALAQTW